MLKNTYIELLSKFTKDETLINELWSEIQENHSSSKRYYHNLQHLENILTQLLEVKEEIQNWDVILFTLYYHDIIYNALKNNNEEKSAEFAVKRMKQLLIDSDKIELCKNQIIATKTHSKSPNKDTNYFLDTDISVLGQSWSNYSKYYKNVRKEYSIYPNLIYNPGRKKVLTHFLKMKIIFKTDYFFDKYNEQAKSNIQKEINLL